MDSQGIKVAMWQEILHNVRCTKRSFLNVRIVIAFLGMKKKLSKIGWKQVDKFLENNGMEPDQHFCRNYSKYRCGITFDAFVVLLYGGGQLRDTNSTNRKEIEENIKWLQNHLLSLLRHSILISSTGIHLGDDSGFLHFDKEKHIEGIGNNSTAALSTAELTQQGQPSRSSLNHVNNDIVTEQKAFVREQMAASDYPEQPNRHTASRQNESASSFDLESHPYDQKDPIAMTFCAGDPEIQSDMHMEPRGNVGESDNPKVDHVGNGSRSQPNKMSLKSINQKYRCKFCQRRFQRKRLGFLIFRRHVKNHEKRYFACRYRSSAEQRKIPCEVKSEGSDSLSCLQRNEASTEMISNHSDDVEIDTKSGFTSCVALERNICGESSIVPTWNAIGMRSVTDPDPSFTSLAYSVSASKAVDEYKVGVPVSCTTSINKNSNVSPLYDNSTGRPHSYVPEACSVDSDLIRQVIDATECATIYNRTPASTAGFITANVSQRYTSTNVIDSQLNASISSVTTCMNTTGQGPSLPTLHSFAARVPPGIKNRTSVSECFLCHEKLPSKESWKEHMDIHNKSQSYTCVFRRCGLVFHTKMSLEEHVQKQHKQQGWCDICHKAVGDFKSHARIHIEKSCPYCPEKFSTQNEFKKHVIKHERQCRYCDKTFKLRSAKLDHEMAVHENKVQYKCEMCSKEFIHREDFKRHKRENACLPRKCNVCGKIYQSVRSLKSHMKYSHNGESRPKSCIYCFKTFTDRNALITHRNTHTDDEKRNLCKVCGKCFRSNGILARHEQSQHSGQQTFCCEFCGKMCRELRNLEVHIRVHTGERPYKCLQCGKGFVNNSNLKQHSYTHTGENPFQCATCKKNFRSVKSLKAHKEIMHHSDEKSEGSTHMTQGDI